MIVVDHRAFHLYREDAYREYCWSVDAWGSYQPASFIYLCFEAFKDSCAEYGLQLVFRPGHKTQDYFPWRYERDSVSEDVRARGLILRIEKAKGSFAKIGANPTEWEFRALTSPGESVRWIEIETDMPGRLFVTKDGFLSDGFFMKGYGYSEENHKQIRALIQSFACFKYNLLRIEFRNVVTTWPTGEPLTIIVDVWNHGPSLAEAMLTLNVSPEFEPVSPLDRRIPPLRTLDRAGFSFQVIPRADGILPLVTNALVSLSGKSGCEVVFDSPRISFVPAIGSPQQSLVPEDNPTLKRLIAVFRDTTMVSEIKSLLELAQIDVRACLNRMRVLAEKIVLRVLDKLEITCQNRNLAAGISVLRERHIVSDRAISYLHTIRIIGNTASHASSDPLSDTDVRIVSYALASVVEELMNRGLL
ncbi:MAG: DUF4145 domain-containing protein [Pseudothermotoga sp.]